MVTHARRSVRRWQRHRKRGKKCLVWRQIRSKSWCNWLSIWEMIMGILIKRRRKKRRRDIRWRSSRYLMGTTSVTKYWSSASTRWMASALPLSFSRKSCSVDYLKLPLKWLTKLSSTKTSKCRKCFLSWSPSRLTCSKKRLTHLGRPRCPTPQSTLICCMLRRGLTGRHPRCW